MKLGKRREELVDNAVLLFVCGTKDVDASSFSVALIFLTRTRPGGAIAYRASTACNHQRRGCVAPVATISS